LALISNNNSLLLTSFVQLDYCFPVLGKKEKSFINHKQCGTVQDIPDDGFPTYCRSEKQSTIPQATIFLIYGRWVL